MEGNSSRKKIGEGRYRDAYLVGPENDHVAKIPKKIIQKEYSFGTIPYPSGPYALLKFGETNLNAVDYANYLKLPEKVRTEFTPHTRMINGVIVQERVMDFDGTPSLTIKDYARDNGKIDNAYFWEKIEELKEVFLAESEPLLGVFHAASSSIMIKKVSETKWIPIIVDFKRLGARSYPFQPQLKVGNQLQEKFLRNFERFEQEFKA